MLDCTSESLLDPTNELLSLGQLLQTLTPSLINILQKLFGTDNLLVDTVQFFVAKVVQDSLESHQRKLSKTVCKTKHFVCGLKLAPGPPRRTVLTIPIVPPTKLLKLTLAVTLVVNKGKNKALGIFRR